MKSRLIIMLLLCLTLFLRLDFGQTIDGNLTGAVLDPTGASVPNATVTVTNTATGVKYSTKTDVDGLYRLNNLPVGDYDVTVAARGFADSGVKDVLVELNKTATANVTVQLRGVTASVAVVEASTTVDTTSSQLQSTFKPEQAVNLPIIESSGSFFGALNLSLLSAGIASNGGIGQGTGPSIGGQRPMNNNFNIEGVDNNNKAVTGPLVYVPNESVAQFSLLQNQSSSEFGHSSGGQFNTIIKGGTNQIHGSAYEYFQNRKLNALDQAYFRQGIYDKPRYDQNRVGGSIGGPIIKNKLFYFGNFEYAPNGQASTASSPVLSPTAQGYS